MLNPIWLNTFKTLVDVGHFTLTAKQLNMTQPGVSQHIQKLEAACGHPLLTRYNKQFELTEQGKQVYQYALTQQQAEQTLIASLSSDDPNKGHCQLACSGSLALLWYPALIEQQLHHPSLTFSLEAAPNQRIIDDVINNHIDLGIVTQQPAHPALVSQYLAEEPLCLITHHTAAHLPISEILARGLIRHPDIDHYLNYFFANCGNALLAETLPSEITCKGYNNQINQILLPIAHGIGFTVLPRSALRQFPMRDALTTWLAPNVVSEQLYIVMKRNRQLPSRFDYLISHVRQLLS